MLLLLGYSTKRFITTPLDSANPISCNRRKFRQPESVYGRLGPFFFAHAQNRYYLRFQSKICYHRRSQRHRFPIQGWKFLRYDNGSDNFLPHFDYACAETAISLLPTKIITTALDSATTTSYKGDISAIGVHILFFFALFFQKSAIFLFPVCLT